MEIQDIEFERTMDEDEKPERYPLIVRLFGVLSIIGGCMQVLLFVLGIIAIVRGRIDFSLPVYLAYSGLSTALLEKYISDSSKLFEEYVSKNDLPYSCIGATIGTHVGPGAIGVAFFAKK